VLIEAAGLAALDITVAGLALIVVFNVSLAWLPGPAFLGAPEPTTQRLSAFNGWLGRNGRMILACTLVVTGLMVATDGLVGLIKKG
jgi:hypothetical protein